MLLEKVIPGRLFDSILLTAILISKVASQTTLNNDILYNTYENTVGACLSDCKAAADQVCSKDLTATTQLPDNLGAVVDYMVTVGACTVRYLNLKTATGGPGARTQCQSAFQGLMNKTAAAPSSDGSCTSRLGGILGNNALGKATSDVIYAYFPKDTPTDGFKATLEGVPAAGAAIRANTAFGVDLSPCGSSNAEDGTANSSTVSSNSLSKRDVDICQSNPAIGLIAGGTALCVASLFLSVVSVGTLTPLGGAICISSLAIAVKGLKDCMNDVDAQGTGGNKLRTRTLTIDGLASTLEQPEHSKEKRIVQSTSSPTLSSSLLPEYCVADRIQLLAHNNKCLAQAFGNKCGTSV